MNIIVARLDSSRVISALCPGLDPFMKSSIQAAAFTLPLYFVLCALFVLSPNPALGYENESVSVLSSRIQLPAGADNVSTFTMHGRFLEGFSRFDRLTLEASLAHSYANSQVSAAYNVQIQPSSDGLEHRLWQQYRYRITLPNSTLDLRPRVEERYFTDTHKAAARTKLQLLWTRPVSGDYSLTLGDELVINLNTMSSSLHRGFSQNRMLAGIRRELANGNRVEFNYQLRYVHHNGSDSTIMHQVQVMFVHRL